MSSEGTENLGRLDDEAEQQEPSSTTDGPAADGVADASQGSPSSGAHPVADSYPDEVTRYDEPVSKRSEPADGA